MPCDSTPRSLPSLMLNGLPSAPGGSTAPTIAQATFMPARTFGAPQTMFNSVPVPASTWQTRRRSASGCLTTSRTSATTTPVNGGATGSTSSTSSPDIVNKCASSSEVMFGSTIVRSQLSENCMIKTLCHRLHKTGAPAPRAQRRSPSVELLQETQIAFIEQAQIVNAVTQHRQAFEAGAEGEADELLGIEAHIAQHRRMHLAGAGDF